MNQIKKILENIVGDYSGRWSEFATSRQFSEVNKICPDLKSIRSLDSISAVLIHKDDIDMIDLEILIDAANEFDVVIDASKLALFSRRNVRNGLRYQRHLIAETQEIHALVNKRASREVKGDREFRTDKLFESLERRLSIRPVSYVGDSISLTVTKHGQMLYVDTLDVSLSPHLLVSGNWEPGITELFRSRIKPGMRYVEIGANCGWFTIQAADLVGREGSVVAFEPNARFAGLIRRNLTINGLRSQAKVVECAVCDKNEEIEFSIFKEYRGNSTLLRADDVAELFGDTYDLVKVPGITLDRYFSAGEHVDFIKIDAESSELIILEGGSRLLAENQRIEIIVEASPYSGSAGAKPHVSDVLKQIGFDCMRIDVNGNLMPDGLSASGIEIFATRGKKV